MTTYTVTTLIDENDGGATPNTPGGLGLSLREALTLANANPAADSIVFAANLSGGVIQLTGSQLTISSDVTIAGDINGDGKPDITVDATNITDASVARVFNITTGASSLDGLIIKGGRIPALNSLTGTDAGGGLNIGIATVTISHSVISGNRATAGGGIYNSGNLKLVDVTMSGNGANYGGAIYNSKIATVALTNATIAGNGATGYGGAMENDGAATLNNVTISGNKASYGGGIFVDHTKAPSTTVFGNSIVAGNAALTSGSDLYVLSVPSLYNTVAPTTFNGRNIFSQAGAGDAEDIVQTDLTQIFAQVAANPDTNVTSGVLADNGGPVKTILIKTGGVAQDGGINAALPADTFDLDHDNNTAETLPYDARNLARVSGGTVDIGAVELPSVPKTTYTGHAADYTTFVFGDGSVRIIDNRPGSPDGTNILDGTSNTITFADATTIQNGNVLTQYNANSTAQVSSFNITGGNYTSTVFAYGKDGYNVFQRFAGVTGYPFSSYEYDFSHGRLIGQKFFYTNVQGQNYSAYEVDTTSAGSQTRVAVTGVTGAPYSSYETNYVGGVYAGLKLHYTSVAQGAAYSSYDYAFDSAGNYSGSKFFYTNVTGQPYTAYEVDYDGAGHAQRLILTGVSGQAYDSYQYDFASNGAVAGSRFFYAAPQGANYDRYEQDYDAAGNATTTKYFYSNVDNPTFHSYEVDQLAGATQKIIKTNNDGSHTQEGYANGLTFTAMGNDTFVGGANQTFVFTEAYGHATISDFYAHMSGANHDTIRFSTSLFADFASMYTHSADVAGGVQITDGTSNTLFLSEVTRAGIAANSGSFAFG